MSQFMIISQPPPWARPFTAAMIGFLPCRRERPPKPEGKGEGAGVEDGEVVEESHSSWCDNQPQYYGQVNDCV